MGYNLKYYPPNEAYFIILNLSSKNESVCRPVLMQK